MANPTALLIVEQDGSWAGWPSELGRDSKENGDLTESGSKGEESRIVVIWAQREQESLGEFAARIRNKLSEASGETFSEVAYVAGTADAGASLSARSIILRSVMMHFVRSRNGILHLDGRRAGEEGERAMEALARVTAELLPGDEIKVSTRISKGEKRAA